MQNDTLVSTCQLFETSLLRFERIVDVQRNVQKIRLTKLCYQKTDGTEKHNKGRTIIFLEGGMKNPEKNCLQNQKSPNKLFADMKRRK